jgi:hypothetical protein
MNEFVATYRTKAGVEVMLVPGLSVFRAIPEVEFLAGRSGVLCATHDIAALFEPIPRPPTVTIPLDVASRYWNQQDSDTDHVTMLAAIQAAEVKK